MAGQKHAAKLDFMDTLISHVYCLEHVAHSKIGYNTHLRHGICVCRENALYTLGLLEELGHTTCILSDIALGLLLLLRTVSVGME